MPKLLYVDDDAIMREIAEVALRRVPGLILSFAKNGAEAIALAESDQFDLIVLDLVMPDQDGINVLNTMRSRRHNRDTPVVFATARSTDDQYSTMFKLGAIGIIAKPLGPSALQLAISSLMQSLPQRSRLLSRTIDHDHAA